MNKGGYQGGLKPTGNPPKPDSFVHDHGTEEGKGLSCRERMINGKLKGECMTELTPEKLREAADVVAAYAFDRRKKAHPSGWWTRKSCV